MKRSRSLAIGIISLAVLLNLFVKVKPLRAATTYDKYLQYGDQLTQEGLSEHTKNNLIFGLLRTLTGNPRNASETGALKFTTSLIASLYTVPPASGVYYAYDVLHRFGAAPAYAQGVGFNGLQPILPIWKAFRNVTYIFFTIIFVAMGLGIMFRIKISPQAVITIENALPKIIGALILVTFSYAIAGLMIDLTYVFIALGITILKGAGINPGLIEILGFNLLHPGPESVINSGFWGLIPAFFSSKSGLTLVGLLVGGAVGSLAGPGGLIMGGMAGPGLIELIWSIIALFLFIKLFFGLVKAYVKIIIAVILGPLQIMAGAIPGLQTKGFGGWLMGLLAEIAIFPAVVVVAMVGVYIVQTPNPLTPMWIAPLIGPPDPTGGLLNLITGPIAGVFFKTIIGMGFLLILANVPDIVRGALGMKASPYESAIGQAFGPITGPFKTYGPAIRQVGIGTGFGLADKTLGKIESTQPGATIFGANVSDLRTRLKNARNVAKDVKVST